MEVKSKNEKWAKKWEKARTKSKWKYCLVYGSLFWGVLACVFSTIFQLIAVDSVFNLKKSIVHLSVFMVIGFFLYRRQWRVNEKRYQQYKEL